MQLQNIPLDQSIGSILVHNIMGADGHKVFAKGHFVQSQDIEKIRALCADQVYAARLEPGDVREDDAAARLARAAAGDGIELSKPSGGRVNLHAAQNGLLRVNLDTLRRFNGLKGVTLATIPRLAPVNPRQLVATLKTVGLALPDETLRRAEEIVRASGPVLTVAAAANRRVGIMLTGSENGKALVQKVFGPPIRARVEELGAQVVAEEFVAEDESAIAAAIDQMASAGAQVIILAGETSIMDAGDIAPRGILRAGGEIELYGAPVEPGNLLLLAYRGAASIIGAPGCIKSREKNAVDLILPRLIAGERVTRADVIELAEGGLLVGE